jgi:hypothetical protein
MFGGVWSLLFDRSHYLIFSSALGVEHAIQRFHCETPPLGPDPVNERVDQQVSLRAPMLKRKTWWANENICKRRSTAFKLAET